MFNTRYITFLENEVAYWKTITAQKDRQIKDLIDKFVFNRRPVEGEVPDNGHLSATPLQQVKPASQSRQDAYSVALQQAEDALKQEKL